jgi:hypothetical protein
METYYVLFIYSSYKDAFRSSNFFRRMWGSWVINWRWYKKMWSWPSLECKLDNCEEELRKTTINLSQGSLSPSRYLNPATPEYKAGVISIQPQRSISLRTDQVISRRGAEIARVARVVKIARVTWLARGKFGHLVHLSHLTHLVSNSTRIINRT